MEEVKISMGVILAGGMTRLTLITDYVVGKQRVMMQSTRAFGTVETHFDRRDRNTVYCRSAGTEKLYLRKRNFNWVQ